MIIQNSGVSTIQGFLCIEVYGETVLTFRIVLSWVSTVEGCLLNVVPLYVCISNYMGDVCVCVHVCVCACVGVCALFVFVRVRCVCVSVSCVLKQTYFPKLMPADWAQA